MPTENSKPDCSKFRIPLMMYIKMQHDDCSIDCCDTEIDAMIGVETDIYKDDEYPNLYEATCLFYNLVDVVSLNPVIVDMYGLFHHNYEIIKEWVKEAWKPEYAELLETDCSGEWEYQLIECISQLISGNVGEKTAELYVKLFKQFKRVPAKADEMVLVPAREVMIEGEVVAGPQNGGVK